jgi:hypothetical protein
MAGGQDSNMDSRVQSPMPIGDLPAEVNNVRAEYLFNPPVKVKVKLVF